MTASRRAATLLALVPSVLTACSGGNGGTSPRSIGGTIAGLAGHGLVLTSPSLTSLELNPGDTRFAFPERVAPGTVYDVGVLCQPVGQTCRVANGAGAVGQTDVTSIAVTCVASLPLEVPAAPAGLALRPIGGLELRYGADQATVAAGDLDGDGHADLAVALDGADAVAVFLGTGAGAFRRAADVPTGAGPWKVLLSDLDGDGRLDLVSANRRAGSVSVHTGTGDGTFDARVDLVTGGPGGWVELADLDGDGHPDLVVSPAPFEPGGFVLEGAHAGGSVYTLRGRGDGTFGPAVPVAEGVGLGVTAAGDLDGDSRADLVVAVAGEWGFRVLLGVGDGTFTPGRDFASGPEPRGLALGDLDGDGALDLVVADYAASALGVFRGRGNGLFAPREDVAVSRAPSAVAIADLDEDGAADVLVSSLTALDIGSFDRLEPSVTVLLGAGDGTFRGAVRAVADAHAYAPAAADLDGDGHLELAVALLDYLDYLRYPSTAFQVGLYRLGAGAPLTVTPRRARGIVPGSGPLAFAASVAGAPRDASWSLSTPVGSLSAASGASVLYTPPPSPGPVRSLSLTAAAAGEQVTVPLDLSPQVARPLGSTSAPNGFLEYLPPGYEDGTPRPLLVFLQGIAGNGNGTTDLVPNLSTWAVPAMISYGAWPADRPFIVLSPQHVGSGCPSGDEVHAFLTWALASYRVDAKRVYLTGLSCGANAAWDYLGTYAGQRVAAAVLLAGNPGAAWVRAGCELGGVAIWAIHGERDGPTAEQTVMSQLAACPAPPRRETKFTLVPDGSHYIFEDVYLGRLGHDVFAWLLEHPKP